MSTYEPGVAREDLQLILDKTPGTVWEGLRGQRIFITGGTGFVGCWLLEALLWADLQLGLGLSITLLTRSPDAFARKAPHLAGNPIVSLFQGDVCDLRHIVEPFEVVIHAATDVVNQGSDFLAAYQAIVAGSMETLALAKRCSATRYLLTSSGAVYGRQPPLLEHVAEDYLGAPELTSLGSAYGQGKRISEWLSHCHAHQAAARPDSGGLRIQVARLFALIGPYLPLDAHFAVGNFIQDGLAERDISVGGDGTAFRSYLYAADMVVWLLTLLMSEKSGQTYNVGSDRAISIKDLADKVSDIIYGRTKVTLACQPTQGMVPQRYVPSTAKARSELGLLEYTDLDTAIRKTINWELARKPQISDSR